LKAGGRYRKLGSIFVLTWLLIVSIISFLPAWSQTTQTAEYPPIEDAYYQSGQNYNDDFLIFDCSTSTILKFNLSDLSGLEIGRIVDIKLKVYSLLSVSASFQVKYCDDNWNEDTITSDPSCENVKSHSLSFPANDWIEFSVWNPSYSNYLTDNYILSIVLRRTDGNSADVKFYSKDNIEQNYIPRLIIEYEPYTETTTQTITETITVTETITETATETQTVTETQTITETQTTYTTSTFTETQTITNVITETATTTITETSTVWANQTVTVTTTITPTVTETATASYGNQTANYYVDLANQLMPLVMVIGVICTMLSLLLSATKGR